jgi:hypothetical protein
MKDIKDMNLAECIVALRDVDVITRGYQCNYDAIEELADRIHELTRWVSVSEKLPTKEDANFHDEVIVSLDPMSIVNSPFGMMGIETVEYSDVCPSKHTHWQRTTEPPEGV